MGRGGFFFYRYPPNSVRKINNSPSKSDFLKVSGTRVPVFYRVNVPVSVPVPAALARVGLLRARRHDMLTGSRATHVAAAGTR